jgi:hypothetical protein
LDDLVLPVIDCTIPLLPHIRIVLILDIHPGIVRVVSYAKLTKFLSK